MPSGRIFVMTYSIVLVVLFVSFSYLMTTIDPPKKPHHVHDTNVSSTKTTPIPTTTTTTTSNTTTTSTTTTTSKTTSKTIDKNKHAREGITAQEFRNKLMYPVNIKGHRRKENSKDELPVSTRYV